MEHFDIQPSQLIELASFDATFAVAPGEEEDVKRRYTTLLADDAGTKRLGTSSTVYRVSNTECETFALKVLKADDLEGEERGRMLSLRIQTFIEEYRTQAAVSRLGDSYGDRHRLCAWRDAVMLWSKSRRIFFIIIFTLEPIK